MLIDAPEFKVWREFSDITDPDEQQKLWVMPVSLKKLLDQRSEIWYIHGNKGVGKTTIATYLHERTMEPPGSKDPHDKLYHETLTVSNSTITREIYQAVYRLTEREVQTLTDANIQLVELTIHSLLYAPLYAALCGVIIRNLKPTSPHHDTLRKLEKAFQFDNDEILLERSKRFLTGILDLPQSPKPEDILSDECRRALTNPYDKLTAIIAKIARDSNLKIRLIIDSVDDDAFSFSIYDQCYVKALIRFVRDINKLFQRAKCSVRLILSCPTEIFQAVDIWNFDQIDMHSVRHYWGSSNALESMVNQALRNELSVHKNYNPLVPVPGLSVVFRSVFPANIRNEFNHETQLFSYLVSYAQNNPRQLLHLVQAVVDEAQEFYDQPFSDIVKDRLSRSRATANDEYDYTEIVRRAVARTSPLIYQSIMKVLKKTHPNIEDVLSLFADSPQIWSKEKAIDYLTQEGIELCKAARADAGEMQHLSGVDILIELQAMGLIGFLVKEQKEKEYVQGFSMHFAYMDGRSYSSAMFEYIFFSPCLWRQYNLRVPGVHRTRLSPDVRVDLHQRLLIWLNSYDYVKKLGLGPDNVMRSI